MSELMPARTVNEAKAKEERAAREKAEAELAAKKRQEEEAEAAKRKAADDAAKAPDREKLLAFAESLILLEIPIVVSKEANGICGQINDNISGLRTWIKQEAKNL